ncbi:hypothetical protein DH86_00001825 [Scytalidium sp. 3C]|nr:hypothetical protein DH86_00001825 [Scytalidium sp. 3C]
MLSLYAVTVLQCFTILRTVNCTTTFDPGFHRSLPTAPNVKSTHRAMIVCLQILGNTAVSADGRIGKCMRGGGDGLR